MSHALLATAIAQTSVATSVLAAQLGYPWSEPLELTLPHGFLIALFARAAWLFKTQPKRGFSVI